jgi:hypothetical protein
MALFPPDFDGAPPRTRGDLGDGIGTWAPNPQDTDFLDRAPDACPREPMLRALGIFLRLSRETRLQRTTNTFKFIREYTLIGEDQLAPHVVVRIAVAHEDKEAENWYATNILGNSEEQENFSQLRDRVYNEQPMEEGAERETSAQDMSEGAEREEEGGTGFHEGALEFTREEDETMVGADLESRRISGAEGGLCGLRLRESQGLRCPQTAKTHEEVRSQLSSRGASGKEASLLAAVRESSAQEQSDQEADEFETGKGVETTGQVLGYFIHKWRRKEDEDQTCADLDQRLSAHPSYVPPPLPAVEADAKMDVIKARSIFGGGAAKEFVFRKGVQMRGAPANTPASEGALAWLAKKCHGAQARWYRGSNDDLLQRF